jgi:hypothetical protein
MQSEQVVLFTQFVIVMYCISFPCKGNNSSFITVECCRINDAPTASGIHISWKKYAISCRGYCAQNFNIIYKQKLFWMFDRIAKVISQNVEQQGPKDWSLRCTWKHFRWCQVNTINTNKSKLITASWYSRQRVHRHFAYIKEVNEEYNRTCCISQSK